MTGRTGSVGSCVRNSDQRNAANRARLRAHLKRLGWARHDLSTWLEAQGEPATVSGIDKWFSDKPANRRRCPAWPSLLIERTPEVAPDEGAGNGGARP